MATAAPADAPPPFTPFVPPEESPAELTWPAVAAGAVLGIVFGASSLYLVLKVGLTVSASIPVAVLAIAAFRPLAGALGMRRPTILENNVVQTTGSAGESIAFAVGLAMPALLLLGYDIEIVRVTTVAVLGGLLGILMMIPLRRAFVVRQHGTLKYPEGTACAEVLIAGEKGGLSANTIYAGMGLGFFHQIGHQLLKLWKTEAEVPLTTAKGAGLKGGAIGAEMTPALLGVGYIIGPRIASIMVAGGVLAYLVLVPLIVYLGEAINTPVAPGTKLVKEMSGGEIRGAYILYIGAGAVAAGGIISMLKALPVIVGSVKSGFTDFANERKAAKSGTRAAVPRTERDLPMTVVLFGSIGMVAALMVAPTLGLGISLAGFTGALMILLFGFLFVTVSSRLTGEIGSSSNPISGMTIATLLLTCLVIVVLNGFGLIPISQETKLLALTVAAVVCVASSNGGTTSQALKTGHLVGATPRAQQYAILIGSLTSALVIGFTLLAINHLGTTYSKQELPQAVVNVSKLTEKETVRRGMYVQDQKEYFVLNVGRGKTTEIPPGRYLVDETGKIAYLVDPAINGKRKVEDDGTEAKIKFDAPKTELIALIINGVFDRDLPWNLVLIGVLIAVTLELSGVPSLPFAVGVYLPLSSSTPIFLGGMIRAAVDRFRKSGTADGDSGPGVLLASGLIAGGSIAALLVAFMNFDERIVSAADLSKRLGDGWNASDWPAFGAYAVLGLVLFAAGVQWLFRPRQTPPAAEVAPKSTTE